MTWSEIKPSEEERREVLGAARRRSISRRRLSYAVITGVPQLQLVPHSHSLLLHPHRGSGWLSRKAVLHMPVGCHHKGEEPPPAFDRLCIY